MITYTKPFYLLFFFSICVICESYTYSSSRMLLLFTRFFLLSYDVLFLLSLTFIPILRRQLHLILYMYLLCMHKLIFVSFVERDSTYYFHQIQLYIRTYIQFIYCIYLYKCGEKKFYVKSCLTLCSQ